MEKVSAEEIGYLLADITYIHFWKKGHKTIFKNPFISNDKRKLKQLKAELLIAIYFIGNFIICSEQASRDIGERMSTSYFDTWEAFAERHSSIASNKFNERMDKYEGFLRNLIEKRDGEKNIFEFVSEEICDFCGYGIGKEMRELLGEEPFAMRVFYAKFSLLTELVETAKAIKGFLKGIEKDYEII